ncbi:MAG: ribosome-recycling factor [Candidatus Kaiserbacteria bacterium]|nr:ribosome-recycling factor [Candidatus Kaiserbacteria bacterium]
MMQYDFSSFSEREEEALKWLSAEYVQIQSGRITTALLDRVTVSAYGAKTALNHCATIAVEDAKTLTVTPYDPTLLPDIEAALREQAPSVSVAVGETTVRVITPDLTGERRAMLEKTARERMEEAKQSIRGGREKILSDMKQKKADGALSEDEEFTIKKELQEKIDTANKKVEEMCEKKVQDIQV